MTETEQRYARVISGFGSRLARVSAKQWSAPTPCSEWDVQSLVAHVVTTHWRIEGTAGREADTSGDLVAQWQEASVAVSDALADPARASAIRGGMFGEQSFESLVSRLLCSDTLYHTWDLARATGQDEELDQDAVEKSLEFLTPMDEAIRRPGGFAPKIEPGADAAVQTRWLNFGGRAA